MASAQTIDKALSNLAVTQYLSGDASTAKDIGWVDMQDFGGILISCTAAALTGLGVTAFTIVANSASDGTGDEAIVVAHAVGTAPDAAGDYIFLECSAEQIGALGDDNGYDLRYVSAKVTAANAADNIVVTYIRHSPKRAYDGMTSDTIA